MPASSEAPAAEASRAPPAPQVRVEAPSRIRHVAYFDGAVRVATPQGLWRLALGAEAPDGRFGLRPDSALHRRLYGTADADRWEADEQLQEEMRALTVDASGALWVVHGAQAYRIDPEGRRAPDERQALDENAPQRAQALFAVERDLSLRTAVPAGTEALWLAGEHGVSRHHPAHRPLGASWPVLVRRVVTLASDSVVYGSRVRRTHAVLNADAAPSTPAAGTETAAAEKGTTEVPRADAAAPLQVSFEEGPLQFEFAAPVFSEQTLLEYRHRLRGREDTWTPWTQVARAQYAQLAPGTYTFEVQARKAALWSSPVTSLTVRVLPPWYRTVWAYLLFIGIGGGLIVALVWRRIHTHQAKTDRLRRVVSARTAKIENQKQTLEDVNAELQRTNDALIEAVEQKSEMLSVAAHDLKNPIYGVHALAEILLERDNLDADLRRKLALMRRSSDEALGLINDLLAAAASSADANLDLEPLDIATMAAWVRQSFAMQAKRKNQDLHIDVQAETPCLVYGDERKLREAISNLVSNAVKYSPHGTAIEIVVRRVEDEAQVAVRDEGPGLDEDDQRKLFMPFQRLTPEPTGDESSSGLGLYIVKQIVEMHDGRIWADTEKGKGSTFAFALPLHWRGEGDGEAPGDDAARFSSGASVTPRTAAASPRTRDEPSPE